MNDNTKKMVLAAMKRDFPGFPVTINESPEDTSMLLVMVFAVPSDQVRVVKNFIHSLQDHLPMNTDIILLPMVKNIKVTNQYYPEYLLIAPESSFVQIAAQFLSGTVQQPGKWQPAKCDAICACDNPAALKTSVSDMMSKITDITVYHKQAYENPVTANEEQAFAA